MERVLTGDVAWPTLVVTVRRQMASLVGSSDELDDLTQTALERVVRGVDKFEGRAELATYTYRTCVRVALNHWRWRRRWRARYVMGPLELEASDADPAEVLLAKQRRRRVHAALDAMRPKHRLLIALADLEELPASRVAQILGCPEPTVRSRLRSARAELAARLARDPVFDERRLRRRAAACAIALALLLLLAAAFAMARGTAPTLPTPRQHKAKSALNMRQLEVDRTERAPALDVETPVPTPLDLRAEFRRAEDELARGELRSALTRLSRVEAARDLALAGDAIFLATKWTDDPRTRVRLLVGYLARRPPTPYAQQALVERGHAHADAGELDAARAIVADLRRSSIPPVVRPGFLRLARRVE